MIKTILAIAFAILISSFVYADIVSDSPGLKKARNHLVQTTIKDRGISDLGVIAAMKAVPRHRFVPQNLLPAAQGSVQ